MMPDAIKAAEDRLVFIASADVSPLIGQTLAGFTAFFSYRIDAFDGKRGVVVQMRASAPPGAASIRDVPICMVDYC